MDLLLWGFVAFIGYMIYSWLKSRGGSSFDLHQYQIDQIKKFPHFDSPRFIDIMDEYDAMETNYLRLKTRYATQLDKASELNTDWKNYVDALYKLRSARLMLDVDTSDDAYDNFWQATKEPTIVQEETQKKFKKLLGKDLTKVPLDYDAKQKKAGKEDNLFEPGAWKKHYSESANYFRMIEYRQKEDK